MSFAPEYAVWAVMIQRCTNPDNKAYGRYGGRGISVCDRWEYSFINFYDDMGARPNKEHSIERLDNDSNYCPENCCWATATIQATNKRKRVDNKSGKTGVSWIKRDSKWVANITHEGVLHRIGLFDVLDEAIVAREKAELRYLGKTRD